MKKLQSSLTVFITLVALVCSAQKAKPNRQLAHLPPTVRQAIRARVGENKIESVEKNDDNGDVVYDVEWTLNDKDRSFTVDDQGRLLDEEVFLEELPAAVQRTIRMQTGGATLDEIDKSVEDGETSYDVGIVVNGKTRNFTVDGAGKLLEQQVFAEDLSPVIRNAILKQAGGGDLKEIDKSIEDGETTYDVEVTRDGKTVEFTVDGAGSLLEADVSLAELPAALQAAIQKETGANTIDGIEKSFDDGEVSYDVDVTGNSRSRTLSFDPDGKLLSAEQDVKATDTPEAVQTQIKSLANGGKLLGISKTTEDGEVYYDVGVEAGGAQKLVSLDSDGKIIPDEEDK